MSRVLCLALMVVIALQETNAISPELCRVKSGPNHCLTSPFKGYTRYLYDWDLKECLALNWSRDCSIPVGVNNFPDYDTCYKECRGWA